MSINLNKSAQCLHLLLTEQVNWGSHTEVKHRLTEIDVLNKCEAMMRDSEDEGLADISLRFLIRRIQM